MIESGYKQAYTERLQANVNQEINQVSLSVADTKQNIFQGLANNLNQISAIQQQEIGNMGRMAGSLEQYHEYVKGLTDLGGNKYTDANKFNIAEGATFEDNYNNLFGMNKGTVAGYLDENNNPALAYEDWLRQNEKDTDWLDWAYGGGMAQYQDFIKYIDPNNKGSKALDYLAGSTTTPTTANWLDKEYKYKWQNILIDYLKQGKFGAFNGS